MGAIDKISYQVPFYETDVNHNMKLSQLLSLALHVSGLQSLRLGVSDDVLFERYNLVWVITDYDIDIERLPQYAERIEIETEAIAYNRLFCYRDFRVFGEDGQQIVTVHSTFVLMDYDTRKVHSVIPEIAEAYDCEKIKKILRGPKYDDLESPDATRFHVRYFDLDMNGHVNNSKYFEWMYEVMDIAFLRQHVPQKITLKYVKEVQYGNDISSRVTMDGLTSGHEIVSEGSVRAQAVIQWRTI